MDKRTIQGVHFLRLHGTAVERGRAHGVLLKTEIPDGALTALSHKNEWMIRRGPGLVEYKPVQDVLVWFYKRVLMPWLDRRTGKTFRNVMKAISFETGVPYEVCRESLFQAEGLMLLSRFSVMKYLLREIGFHEALPGCTSAIVDGSWTKSGRIMMCRNMDYPIVGPWEKHTTVLFHEPTETNEIPHVSITSAGIHTSGLTTMNREGLVLATHAHFTRKLNVFGQPIVLVGSKTIRRARTIGEAVDLIRKTPRIANWAFTMCSAKEKRGVVIEMNPNECVVREMDEGYIGHSNFFHKRPVRDPEANISGGCTEDLWNRYCRIGQVLEQFKGQIEPYHMAQALSDNVDPLTGVQRVMGNTVSVVTTLKSAIFDPEAQRFWIATRKESPTSHGEFLQIDVDQFWKHNPPHHEYPVIKEHLASKHPSLSEGIHFYREAYRAWHVNNHEPDYMEKTKLGLEKAIKVYPSDGNLWFLLGLICFRMKMWIESEKSFQRVKDLKISEHVGQVTDLFLARCHDIHDRREKALEIYRKADGVKEPRLRKAYQQGLRKKYNPKNVNLVMIDLQFPDAMQY